MIKFYKYLNFKFYEIKFKYMYNYSFILQKDASNFLQLLHTKTFYKNIN
jgi:hypothetical protein